MEPRDGIEPSFRRSARRVLPLNDLGALAFGISTCLRKNSFPSKDAFLYSSLYRCSLSFNALVLSLPSEFEASSRILFKTGSEGWGRTIVPTFKVSCPAD